jgi:hypothetical protein
MCAQSDEEKIASGHMKKTSRPKDADPARTVPRAVRPLLVRRSKLRVQNSKPGITIEISPPSDPKDPRREHE